MGLILSAAVTKIQTIKIFAFQSFCILVSKRNVHAGMSVLINEKRLTPNRCRQFCESNAVITILQVVNIANIKYCLGGRAKSTVCPDAITLISAHKITR